MKIVLASGNAGKLKEFQTLFSDSAIEVFAQSEFSVSPAAETGLSFIENALLKARHASKETGLPALADDSGLAVDALNGEPGIFSARYAGAAATDEQNIEKLLAEMRGIAPPERSARFICALAFIRHPNDPVPVIVQAQWPGQILEAKEGEGGFGYDPVFYIPALNCSAAALSKQEKNRISHRGQATNKLFEQFAELDLV